MVCVFAVLWIVAALVAWWRNPDRNAFVERMRMPVASFWAAIGLLVLAEAILGVLFPPELYLRPPGTKLLFHTDEKVEPGVRSGQTLLVADNVGLRGPNLHVGDGSYKIVLAGANTAESAYYLDDSQDLARLMMIGFNARSKERVWAASANIGHDTRDHLRVLQTLPVFHKVQMVIWLVGAADLQNSLDLEGRTTDEALEASAGTYMNWLETPPSQNNPLARTDLYRLSAWAFRGALPATEGLFRFDNYLVQQRQLRQRSKTVPLPDLGSAIEEYRKGVVALGAECRKQGLRCLFLTQPTMWRDGLNQTERELIWSGGVGPPDAPKGYVSINDLAQAMTRYNQTLLDACSSKGLECYDLATHVPKDESAMFDDCHFNENGAHIVAGLLAGYLSSHPPSLSAEAAR
jgi:hypothetical protein